MSTSPRDLGIRRHKLLHLAHLGREPDVLLVQELRGSPSDVNELHDYCPCFRFFASFGATANAGGVAIGVSRRFQSLYSVMRMEVVHRGRIVVLHCGTLSEQLHSCCVHLVREVGRASPVGQLAMPMMTATSFLLATGT